MHRENLQGNDRQVTVAEPPDQSETETAARGQEKVRGGGVGEIRLVKDDMSGDKDAARGEVKHTTSGQGSNQGTHNESSGTPACEEQWRRC